MNVGLLVPQEMQYVFLFIHIQGYSCVETYRNLAHETLCFAVRRGYALGYVLKGF